MPEPVTEMKQMVALEYAVRPSPLTLDYLGKLRAGRIVGHRCPECELVYVPPRGFCQICVVPTQTPEHEVAIADRGTVTSFTVVDPIQYHGQTEREVYALASILLDGASGTLGQQRIADVPLEQVRMGLRVEAVWIPEAERKSDLRDQGAMLGGSIRHWRPSGEPDTPLSRFQEHIV